MIMEDELFGKITWDESKELLSGKITLGHGKTADFTFDGFETGEWSPEAALKTLKFVTTNESLIRRKIAVLLIENYNDTWLYENTLTPDEIAGKIYLHNAEISTDDGSAELYYEADEDLFAYHWVQVPIDADGEIGEPLIEG